MVTPPGGLGTVLSGHWALAGGRWGNKKERPKPVSAEVHSTGGRREGTVCLKVPAGLPCLFLFACNSAQPVVSAR